MKTVILFLFLSISLHAQIDTIYTDFTPVRSKATTIKVTTKAGDEITEKKESITYDKALLKIERLKQDTAQYNQFFINIKRMEESFNLEKKRIRMMRRDAIATLERLNNLLNTLK
jgi:plasmid maintenance system antidote protein VapI